MENHIKELFVFVAEPQVPPDNNAAERSLRHLVVSRKISGGHSLAPRHRHQDDPGLNLRYLAGTRSQPPHRLPTTAHFPSSLNCYRLRIGARLKVAGSWAPCYIEIVGAGRSAAR